MEIVLPYTEPLELQGGDIILANGLVLLVLENDEDDWTLVDLANNNIFAQLNHPVHIINHIKKHVSTEFEIIKHHKIKLTIG